MILPHTNITPIPTLPKPAATPSLWNTRQVEIDENFAAVKEAIEAGDGSLAAHLSDTDDAHDASSISNEPAGNLTATTVQAALNELQTDVDTRATSASVAAQIAALALKAPLASPALTGNPTAPTPAQFDNDTSLATTAFVQRALGSFSGVASYAAAATLTAADVGKSILATGGTFTLTLPVASAVPAGGCIQVSCNSGTVTVQRAGADVISGVPSTTAIVLGVGDTIMLRSNGAAGWLAVSGSAQLVSAAVFGASLAANGYQKLPSGLIIQWGTTGVITAGSSATITAPIALPNAMLNVTFGPQSTSNSTTPIAAAWQAISSSQFTARNESTITANFSYLIIGH